MRLLPLKSRLMSKKFEGLSKQAIALTKGLLYQIDGLAFVEALETGATLT